MEVSVGFFHVFHRLFLYSGLYFFSKYSIGTDFKQIYTLFNFRLVELLEFLFFANHIIRKPLLNLKSCVNLDLGNLLITNNFLSFEQTIQDAVKGSFTILTQQIEDHPFKLGRDGLFLFFRYISYICLVNIIDFIRKKK